MDGSVRKLVQRAPAGAPDTMPPQPRVTPAPAPMPDAAALRSRVSQFIQDHFGRGNKINPLLSAEQLAQCSALLDEYHASWPRIRRAEKWLMWSGGLVSVPLVGIIFTKMREKFNGDAHNVALLLLPALIPYAAFLVFHSRADRYFHLGEIIQNKCLSEDSEARSTSQEGGSSAWRHVFAALDAPVRVHEEMPALDLPVTIGGDVYLDEVPVGVTVVSSAILVGAVALVTASFFVPWEVALPEVVVAPALAW